MTLTTASQLEISIRQFQHALQFFQRDDDVDRIIRIIGIPSIAENMDLPLLLGIAELLSANLAAMKSIREALVESCMTSQRRTHDGRDQTTGNA